MGWLKKFVLHNWWLKLLSLALAYALWAIVTQSPPVEVAVSVPLELRNLPTNLQVTGHIPPRVHVHLRGPERRLRTLAPEEVAVVVDLKGLSPGNHWLQLDARHVEAPPGVEVVHMTPNELQLELTPR